MVETIRALDIESSRLTALILKRDATIERLTTDLLAVGASLKELQTRHVSQRDAARRKDANMVADMLAKDATIERVKEVSDGLDNTIKRVKDVVIAERRNAPMTPTGALARAYQQGRRDMTNTVRAAIEQS